MAQPTSAVQEVLILVALSLATPLLLMCCTAVHIPTANVWGPSSGGQHIRLTQSATEALPFHHVSGDG